MAPCFTRNYSRLFFSKQHVSIVIENGKYRYIYSLLLPDYVFFFYFIQKCINSLANVKKFHSKKQKQK